MMGCSNPHPHGQVWSLSHVPTIPAKELANLRAYASANPNPLTLAPKAITGSANMLLEYAHYERGAPLDQGRTVIINDEWIALVPWWAVWPFETLGI